LLIPVLLSLSKHRPSLARTIDEKIGTSTGSARAVKLVTPDLVSSGFSREAGSSDHFDATARLVAGRPFRRKSRFRPNRTLPA
jgi:hypothetical protein